jgi:hypothetical protein
MSEHKESTQKEIWIDDLISYGDEAYKRWEYRSNFTQLRQFKSNDEVPTRYAGSMIIYRKTLQQSQSV